jgi:hypothetical protein
MVTEMINHRNPKDWKLAIKSFCKILMHHCERVEIKNEDSDSPMIEVYDFNDEIIAEIDYSDKKVLCQNKGIEDHISQLLDIHNQSNIS